MKHNFKLLISGFIIVLIVQIFTGCGSSRVNLPSMPPEEQLLTAMKTFQKKDYYQAKNQFTIVVLNNRGHRIIEEAQFYLGECHYHLKEYILAIAEYEKLIRTLPRSEFVDDARYKIGMCYYKLAPNYALDQEYTIKAISEFQQFLIEYPESELLEVVEERMHECQEKLARKAYKAGELYRKMGYYKSAIISYELMLNEYPESKYVDDAMFFKGECHRLMSEDDEAEKLYQNLVRIFPESEWKERALARIDQFK